MSDEKLPMKQAIEKAIDKLQAKTGASKLISFGEKLVKVTDTLQAKDTVHAGSLVSNAGKQGVLHAGGSIQPVKLTPNGNPFIPGSFIKLQSWLNPLIPSCFHGKVCIVESDMHGMFVNLNSNTFYLEELELAKYFVLAHALPAYVYFDDISGSTKAYDLTDLDNPDVDANAWRTSETVGTPIAKPCTCSSRDLFHKGCNCGHLKGNK